MHTLVRAVSWVILWAATLPAVAQDAQHPPAFKPEQLEQLVAPIALYPDALVAQILMGSTYPLEIVEAARWSKANPGVKDKALEDAMQKQSWDASVKSLAAFPQVLTMMNDKLDWTQQLGDAFLGQQKEVMAAVQTLRSKASAQGNLKSSKEQTVSTEQSGSQTVIKIEPADPKVVYVPTYNPTVVYGSWPYPAYPPYYYYPPGYVAGAAFFSFTAGVIVGNALWGNCNWGGGNVNVNVNNYNNFNRTNVQNSNWQHNPENRKGVQYRDSASQQKYGKGQSKDTASRDAFRGRAEQGRQDIARGAADGVKRDGGRQGGDLGGRGGQDRAGDRGAGGIGDRSGGGVGDRAGTADRAGGGPGDRSGGSIGDRSGGSVGDRSGGGLGDRGGGQGASGRQSGAFDGVGRGGQTSSFSNRGAASRGSMSGGGARGGGGGGRRR